MVVFEASDLTSQSEVRPTEAEFELFSDAADIRLQNGVFETGWIVRRISFSDAK